MASRGPRPHVRFALVCLGLVAALGVACDRRLEAFVPAEEEPAPTEQPVRVPGLASPDIGRQLTDSRSRPPEQRDGGAEGTSGRLRGTVRVADGVQAPAGGVLFVIARPASGGPPLAVARLEPTLPQRFDLGPENVMMEGRPLAGPILMSARLDSDGDPLTRGPGDLSAALGGPIEPGAEGLELILRSGP